MTCLATASAMQKRLDRNRRFGVHKEQQNGTLKFKKRAPRQTHPGGPSDSFNVDVLLGGDRPYGRAPVQLNTKV
jgi:hypothetical protein